MVRIALIAISLSLVAAATASAVDVEAIYDKKCKLCHSIKGEGGKKKEVGGPLDGAAAKRGEEWTRAYMADPKSKIPDAKMPKVKLDPDEMNAMIKFLMGI